MLHYRSACAHVIQLINLTAIQEHNWLTENTSKWSTMCWMSIQTSCSLYCIDSVNSYQACSRFVVVDCNFIVIFLKNKLCLRAPQYAPAPASWPLTFWPWKRCPSHCANFSLPRPLCSRLRPDVRNRQTDVRRASSLNAPYYRGGGITMLMLLSSLVYNFARRSVEASIVPYRL